MTAVSPQAQLNINTAFPAPDIGVFDNHPHSSILWVMTQPTYPERSR